MITEEALQDLISKADYYLKVNWADGFSDGLKEAEIAQQQLEIAIKNAREAVKPTGACVIERKIESTTIPGWQPVWS
jgi:hypothetical protein